MEIENVFFYFKLLRIREKNSAFSISTLGLCFPEHVSNVKPPQPAILEERSVNSLLPGETKLGDRKTLESCYYDILVNCK